MPEVDKYAVIVAGGSGTRMGSAVPKQFLLLSGKPVLYYSIAAFLEAFTDIKIILVLPNGHEYYTTSLLELFPSSANITVVNGGETRYHSVQNGLKKVHGEAVVFIHDGVRPMVSKQLIHACYTQALEKGSAIPAIPVTDSIRMVRSGGSDPVSREELRIIQTPQTFLSRIILPAFAQEYSTLFTDEATVAEAYGNEVYLVAGERSNLKVTTPEDMILAEALLNARLKNE
ncbi:MAG: 2-C-methyl-D-erythritol 4-phosphate cytidylyltransferase [Flavipsychrobacter sp.]|nr:2-C-methyl-D-erythritol 4-phosphate cytidylyltransferase [Flavipsychrobacter sp.]